MSKPAEALDQRDGYPDAMPKEPVPPPSFPDDRPHRSRILRETPGAGRAVLQVLGLMASSHWLFAAAAATPGFEASELARTTRAMAVSTPGELLRALVLVAALPAFFEELLFRGLLFAAFERFLDMRAALIGSALLFGAAHWDLHHAAVAAALGLQLGAIRATYGLPLAIAAHFANNALAVLAAYAAASPLAEPVPRAAGDSSTTTTVLLALLISGIACAALAQARRSPASQTADRRTGLQPFSRKDD